MALFDDTFASRLSTNIQEYMGAVFRRRPEPEYEGLLHPAMVAFIDNLSNAITASWQNYFNGLSLMPLTTIGGRGGPSGSPLSGVISLFIPGSLLSTTPFNGIQNNYVNPFSDATTGHVLALLNALDSAMSLVGVIYATSYMKMPLRMSGISGWISGTPTIPGPYTNGPVTGGQLLSHGISTALPVQISMAGAINNFMVAYLSSPFDISLWYTNSHLGLFMYNVARGIAKQWFEQFLPNVAFSGGTPVGICYPGGSVTAVTSGVQLND